MEKEMKFSFYDRKYFSYALGVTAMARFCLRKESVSVPESFVYVAIAVVIAGYWAFDAWLATRERSQPIADEETKKEIAELKTKVNALSLREALRS